MLRHKQIDRICCAVLAVTLLLTCGFMGAAAGGFIEGERAMGYESRLFDQSRVHTIDIVMDGWEEFIAGCTDEEYASCTVVIDGEKFGNVAIRAKGNTSLSQVSSYGNNRYSFKIEFDQYQSGMSYHGLDKLSLNNLIQDKTFMKDYLAYTLMGRMGVAAPLCSFAEIRVNGEAWGVYLAVEAVEDSFLARNYGSDHGELYKPDSMSFGGGRGNGRDFDMDEFREKWNSEMGEAADSGAQTVRPQGMGRMRMGMGGMQWSAASQSTGETSGGETPAGQTGGAFDPSQLFGGRFDPSQMTGKDFDPSEMFGEDGSFEMPDMGGKGGFGGGGMGSADVMLQYIDDDPVSYENIFNNAKTDVSEADKERLIASLKALSEGENIESAADVEAVIRYLAVHNFLVNDDSYTGNMIHNYYLYEEDGRLSMIPWDYNLAFGAFSMGGGFSGTGATSAVNRAIDSPVSSGDISTRPMISWIFESEEYTALYHEICREFIAMLSDGGWLDCEIARVQAMLAPYIENDPTAFFTEEQFTTACETLREFCGLRMDSITGQLDGSIPSTTEGQRADSTKLIDASHVSLDDLGEFGMGGFGGMGQMTPPDGQTMPDMNGATGGMPDGMNMPTGGFGGMGQMTPPDGQTAASEDTAGEPAAETPQDNETTRGQGSRTMNRNMDFPRNDLPEAGGSSAEGRLPMLAACAAVLLAALIFARFFKSGR